MDARVEPTAALKPKLAVRDLNFYYGGFQALKSITLDIPEKKVTSFIGPSGCGKSTLLRTFNRMYELYPEQRAEGEIVMDGSNLLTSKDDISLIRAKIGMVFQKPTPFPMSIYDNIAFGVKLFESLPRVEMDERIEWALRKAALGARSDLDRQDRRADPRAEGRLHGGDRHPQHAAGGALLRLHRLHVPRRPDRVRPHQRRLHATEEKGHRGLHHRPVRLAFTAGTPS